MVGIEAGAGLWMTSDLMGLLYCTSHKGIDTCKQVQDVPLHLHTGLAKGTTGWQVHSVERSTSYAGESNEHPPAAAKTACWNVARGLLTKESWVRGQTKHLLRDQDILHWTWQLGHFRQCTPQEQVQWPQQELSHRPLCFSHLLQYMVQYRNKQSSDNDSNHMDNHPPTGLNCMWLYYDSFTNCSQKPTLQIRYRRFLDSGQVPANQQDQLWAIISCVTKSHFGCVNSC